MSLYQAGRARTPAGLALSVLLGLIAACSSAPAASPVRTTDPAAAAQQARTFHTMATPDSYGNYGEQLTTFCQANFDFDCNREDRDLGESLLSAQEIQQWDAERNNPQSVLADIGILFIPQAEEAGILSDYRPQNADLLPDDLSGPGWVATFVGAPTLMVNLDALDALGVPAPESWADLTNPDYRGLVGLARVGVASSATWALVAMNLAAGGTLENWQPAIDYGRALLPNITQQATLDTFARGEVPISIRMDFNQAPWREDLDAQGVRYRLFVPEDGSVFGASTLMLNRYDTAHADFGRMFMDWVLSDEGQVIFAKYGARPIRSVTGDDRLVVPDEARAKWLPDAEYESVQTVDWRLIDPVELQEMWETQVAGGG